MSKYRIVNVPDVKEAKCANCGSSKNDGRLYIDCNLDIDWYGTVFFCGLCLKELATAMGLFTELEEKISALIDRRNQDENLLKVGEKLDESVRQMVIQLKEFYVALHPTGLVDTPNSSSVVVSSDSNSGIGVKRDNPDVNETESGAIKPASSARRKNIRSLAELLDDTDS